MLVPIIKNPKLAVLGSLKVAVRKVRFHGLKDSCMHTGVRVADQTKMHGVPKPIFF